MKNRLKDALVIAAGIYIGVIALAITGALLAAILGAWALSSFSSAGEATSSTSSAPALPSYDQWLKDNPQYAPTPMGVTPGDPNNGIDCTTVPFDPKDPNRNPLCDPNFDPKNYSGDPGAE